MMSSPTNTIKTIKLKKPLVVIKKGFLFKPNNVVVQRPELKRSIVNESATQSPTAKRPCVTMPNCETPIVCTYVISSVKTQKPTQGNVNNATSNRYIPDSFIEVVLEENPSKKSRDKNNAIKKEFTTSDYNRELCNITNNTEPKRDNKYKPQTFMRRNEDSRHTEPSRCLKHEVLPQHQAEGLLKVGDTFKSLPEFDAYTNMYAQKWFFYYARSDSRNLKTGPNYDSTKPTYIHYFCRFNKNRNKSRSKGIRKRSEYRTKCPAAVTVKCAAGKDEYKVLNVCHHHSHELSLEIFNNTPHGHRLPKEIKEEIRDLALFHLDPLITRRYIESKMPGLTLKKTVYNRIQSAKKTDSKDSMSPEKVEEMLAKIKYIKSNFSNAYSRVSSPKTDKETKSGLTASSRNIVIVPRKPTEKVQILDSSKIKLGNVKILYNEELMRYVKTSPNKAGNVKILYNEDLMRNVNELQKSSRGTATQGNSSEESMDGVKSDNIDCKIDNIDTKTENVLVEVKPNNNKTTEPPASKVEYFPLESRCLRRHVKFPEHKAEGLVKVGDTFSSIEEFVSYAAAHASKWFFYYQVHNSRNVKTTDRYNSTKKTAYNLMCRFNKGWYKSKSIGLRKVKRKTIRCPAMVNMMCKPGEDTFKVMYVCHHHSHELSYEVFSQEAHGHRLPTELKEEIRELAWFQLDRSLMRQYLKKKTGLDLRPTIKNVIAKMRLENQKLHMTPEKEKEILDKIRDIKQNFDILQRVSPKNKQTYEEGGSDSEDEGSSRVEARLNNILYDEELRQSVRDLQASTGCELRIIPWEDVNHSNDASSHLQAGVILDTNDDHKPTTSQEDEPPDDDNTDNYGNQVEVDQELYTMDEDVQYIVPSEQDGTFVVDEHTQQNVQYIVPSEHDGTNTFAVDDNTQQKVHYIVPTDHDDNFTVHHQTTTDNFTVQDTTQQSVHYIVQSDHDGSDTFVVDDTTHQKVHYIVPPDHDGTDTFVVDDPTQQDVTICRDDIATVDEDTQLTNYYENNEGKEYHVMYEYTNDDDSHIENESSEHKSYVKICSKKTESRDIGVQADFEIIEIESNYEKIKNLESEMMKEDLAQSRISVSTRGRPKVVLEDAIINRYNIEFYINVGGIVPCLEQLADSMKLSVLHLLNRVYQGDAVLKMALGRSGKLDRKTVHLTYVPLTIAFPYKRLKYINSLEEYKKICSQYSDVTVKLENTIESMSRELKETKEKLKNIESQKDEFIRVMKNHETLVKNHTLNQQLLKKTRDHLIETQNENKVLLKKVKYLEFLQITSQPKDHALEQQLLKNNQDDLAKANSKIQELSEKLKKLESLKLSSQQQDGTTTLQDDGFLKQLLLEPTKCENRIINNTVLEDKSKVVEDKSHTGPIKLIEQTKILEQAVKVSNADIKRYKERLKDVEELNLSDSNMLLDKIDSHEKEISKFRQLGNTKKYASPSSSLLPISESENIKLRDEIKDLKEKISSENKSNQNKINTLQNTVSTLIKQLNEEKTKNLDIKSYDCTSQTDPLA